MRPLKFQLFFSINRGRYIFKGVLDTGQRLAVADKEVSSRKQSFVMLVYDGFFSGLIKVNHYIPAKDGLKRLFKLKFVQNVEVTKGNLFADTLIYLEMSIINLFEVLELPVFRHFHNIIGVVNSAFCLSEHFV